MTQFEGINLKLGNKDYVIPPLNLKAVRKFQNEIMTMTSIKGAITDEQMNSVVKVIHAAISRNYPDITTDELEEIIDLKNMQEVIPAILAASGFLEKKNQVETQNL